MSAIDRQARSGNIANLKSEPVIVIGGGLHAAIFAAAYWRKTGKKPLVVEKEDRLGGVFGISRKPVFYLNSRNRPEVAVDPGEVLGPGTRGPLNTIGGAFELSDISGQEYPPQTDLAYIIRTTLALYARPFTGVQALKIKANGKVDLTGRAHTGPSRTTRSLSRPAWGLLI
jgi:NADPH-dependent 2,4-dienoyl-CoA reductase/sulfur reductase-like enzyme